MVALKNFFKADKDAFAAPGDGPGDGIKDGEPWQTDLPHERTLDVEQHFENIERQFQELHDHFRSRPVSTYSQTTILTPTSFSPPPSRHVDLLDALFSSHRYRIRNKTISPTTPFNEDIAERNMVRFLRGQQYKSKAYSRLLSSLYQEDVADRNIARNSANSVGPASWSPASSRPSSTATGVTSLSPSGGDDQSSQRRVSRRRTARLAKSLNVSKENLRARSQSPRGGSDSGGESASPKGSLQVGSRPPLRQQRSAPSLLVDDSSMRDQPTPSPSASSNHLGVPPAYKQGDMLSNVPLPDSPTLPILMSRQPVPTSRRKHLSDDDKLLYRNSSSSDSRKAAVKKNPRDLSINTELAAFPKPGHSISHRASTLLPKPKRNPSIAEVVNSPLPLAASPTATTLPQPPLSPTNYNAAEIMDMFKQAYLSIQATTPNPSFETLQDAIIREINSHEAFRQVPIPAPGPLFTPSLAQRPSSSSATGTGLGRSVSAREGQFSRLLRRTRNPDSVFRRSLSGAVPEWTGHRRRRHSEALPPSPGFLESMTQGPTGDGVTYMDLIGRSSNKTTTSLPPKPGTSHSARRADTTTTTTTTTTKPRSVYRMRAHTSSSIVAPFKLKQTPAGPMIAPPIVQVESVDV
ncbi:hypothetical protein ASPZODRAFT_127214 [Penicilliopsis zonata CBS 506.65]|uniref:Uncharacterized protein n=1 Tax=Penicilliopsis zonata CBS 506.65 TaxID=1073090 RepID=A0A1L9SVK3_9EURO|nr:hypothetical protein ASPZODRAFT_127214 [Penicilliopsis zonata CBS 506.65]OJJ51186.1 hypothetical protein ASPZODRAFT_127214 [Penicilliopsis zonata CBS 506.65]